MIVKGKIFALDWSIKGAIKLYVRCQRTKLTYEFIVSRLPIEGSILDIDLDTTVLFNSSIKTVGSDCHVVKFSHPKNYRDTAFELLGIKLIEENLKLVA